MDLPRLVGSADMLAPGVQARRRLATRAKAFGPAERYGTDAHPWGFSMQRSTVQPKVSARAGAGEIVVSVGRIASGANRCRGLI